jgi:DNA adenine methylase
MCADALREPENLQLDLFERVRAHARPPLKWAGGKTQLLPEIIAKMPKRYGRYIEPFFGGGALFFAIKPSSAVIADSNPELINLYKALAEDVEGVIECLAQYRNTETSFYRAYAMN